jgi:tripartite-type tricarboxylate transporter receptor subunit TctC
LLGGRVQMFSVGLGVVSQQLQSGALRALAVASPKRLSALPNVPTAAEAGLPGFEMTTWFGILAPRGTPGDIIQSLNGRLQKVLDDAGTRKRLGDAGIEPIGGSAQSFAQTIRADYKRWEPIVRASGAKAD